MDFYDESARLLSERKAEFLFKSISGDSVIKLIGTLSTASGPGAFRSRPWEILAWPHGVVVSFSLARLEVTRKSSDRGRGYLEVPDSLQCNNGEADEILSCPENCID